MNASAPTVYDVAVVGGGPAGLSAAVAAAEHGLLTALFDEQPAPGGQIYRNVENVTASRPRAREILGCDYVEGARLVQALRASSVIYQPGSSVWDIGRDGTLGILADGNAELIRARRIVLTVGAMERPVPLPDWTLPGVMTAGAAQILLKSSSQIPDVPTVLAGSGPLLLLVARQLLAAGAPVRAVLQTMPWANYLRAAPLLPGGLPSAGRDIERGVRWVRDIRRVCTMVRRSVRDLRALGQGGLGAVAFRSGGKTHRINCGLLLLHEGIVPSHQAAMAAGCDIIWDDRQLAWRTRADRWGATSVDTIAVAGDCVGIGGARSAVLSGRLAGIDAAFRAGRIDAGERDRKTRTEAAELIRLERGRRFFDTLFRPSPQIVAPPDDDTVICRCEEVTAGEIRRVVGQGCPGPNQAKAFTRAGMGPCQGRLCGLTVTALIAEARGIAPPRIGTFRVRPPLKPVTVGELADLAGVGREVASLGGLPKPPGGEKPSP